ncbi:MAG: class II aldolase/adducin family protein [Hyphomonadaceae bacterium]
MALSSVNAELQNAVRDLVLANKILYKSGVLDAYGHVSARHPLAPDQFLLSRNLAPALVTAGDILAFGLDGEPTAPTAEPLYLERYIHSEVYRSRPDVVSVVHSHSPSVIPFGVTEERLRPVFHMSAFLGQGAPVFEIRDKFGDETNLLITNSNMGAALADALGESAVLLLRGHGNVVVAPTLRLAVFRAIYTETNAQLQIDALRMGRRKINYLSRGEAKAVTAVAGKLVDRTWDLWVAESGDDSV